MNMSWVEIERKEYGRWASHGNILAKEATRLKVTVLLLDLDIAPGGEHAREL
jgi:hypothetical protein